MRQAFSGLTESQHSRKDTVMIRRSGLLLAALMLASTPVLAEGGNGNDREPAGGAFNSSYSRNVSSDSRPLSATAVGPDQQVTGTLQRRRPMRRP